MAMLRSAPARLAGRRQALAGGLLLGYAAVASALPPLSWQATAAVLAPAGVASVVALRPRRPREHPQPPATRRAVWLWSVLLTLGLLWEAWAFFQQPAWDVASDDHPTLSVLVGPYLEHYAVRFAAWTGWLYAGVRLVRR